MSIKEACLKRKARKWYKEYFNILDSYSCGAKLAEFISERALKAKTEFNKIMEKLEKLDPLCPKFRL